MMWYMYSFEIFVILKEISCEEMGRIHLAHDKDWWELCTHVMNLLLPQMKRMF
jgi:hypothetical protein